MKLSDALVQNLAVGKVYRDHKGPVTGSSPQSKQKIAGEGGVVGCGWLVVVGWLWLIGCGSSSGWCFCVFFWCLEGIF